MDKNEIITLSSDDESDFSNRLEHNLNPSTVIQPVLKKNHELLKLCLEKSQITVKKNVHAKNNVDETKIVKLPNLCETKRRIANKESPELVDLVDYGEKLDANSKDQFQCTNRNSSKNMQENVENHSKLDIIEIYEISNHLLSGSKTGVNVSGCKQEGRILGTSSNIEMNKNNRPEVIVNSIFKSDKNDEGEVQEGKQDKEEFESKLCNRKTKEDCNQNLKFFTEFVEFCGSFEKIPIDRTRLTKKLMKRYGETDTSYIKSQEFKNLIQKCKAKVTQNNLYLIAKEITDELSYRKNVEIDPGNSVHLKKTEEKSQTGQTTVGNNEKAQEVNSKKNKRRTKIINQIIKKLDKLGNKIRELEKKEVDLSDEEESSYVQLQRYRERFCQIHKKLCKYTNEVADAQRICNPKICFTESKYPAINKCIENWLNKTKRFPDFSDILKLLESQSSALGLPSNRESIRTVAIEIFQQVGAMLQRRRMYDLWDSFCEFLDAGEDPANADPTLDQILKSNFEARIKKEQEIFQHFAELQEKERLEPEEVPDEEANRSPIESGSEDDKELEDIENSLHRKLDVAIIKETEDIENTVGKKDWDGGGRIRDEFPSLNLENYIKKSKESKNNFRNCKSLKWRSENCGKTACLKVNSEDSNPGSENEKGKKSESVTVEKFKPDTKGIYDKIKTEMIQLYVSPTKRALDLENEDPVPSKKKYIEKSKNEDFDIFYFDDENDNPKEKTNEVFSVHCCQIFADNVFEGLYEKKRGREKRRVFRDLTNVNRLMELHRKRRKMSELYSPSFFHRSFLEFEKSSWKKRFKVSYKFVGSKNQKCALNQEEKSQKTVSSNSGRGTEEKNIRSNSGGGRNGEGDNFFSGHGNGNEEDNNEDKNKKNGKTNKEINDNQLEEDEDEEENEDEKDEIILCDESAELFLPKNKVQKTQDTNQVNKTLLESVENSNESAKAMHLATASALESKNEIEDEEPSEKTPNSGKDTLKEIQKKTESSRKKACSKKKIGFHSNKKTNISKNKGVSQNETENAESYIDKNLGFKVSTNETVEDQDEELEVKTLINRIRDELESEEESKPVGEEKEKEGNKVIKSESSGAKTESRSHVQNLMKVKNESQSTAPDVRKEIANSGGAEEEDYRREALIFKKNESKKTETLKRETATNKSVPSCKPIQFDLTSPKIQKRNAPSTSDEERVKRFLLHSPSSISITPPRKLSLSKPPSQAALQALATLRNLKGISATIVKGKPKNEDEVVVIGGSYKRPVHQNSDPAKRRRYDLPTISSVQSADSITPKIVTVQGNVSGFDNSWQELPNNGNSECSSSSIRISNVWGSLPNNFVHSEEKDESDTPGCSSQQTNPSSSSLPKKKNTKKAVEYVVID